MVAELQRRNAAKDRRWHEVAGKVVVASSKNVILGSGDGGDKRVGRVHFYR